MPDMIRVLYIDDEPTLLEIAKVFLEKMRKFWVALDTVFLCVLIGVVAITVHKMGHRFAAHHHKVLTEVRFWEVCTVVIFFTG